MNERLTLVDRMALLIVLLFILTVVHFAVEDVATAMHAGGIS